jgi:putative tryptophan/tyrosine transport system permease protein
VNLLIGAITIGLILALLGLGVFVTYRIYRILDLTADGAFGIGAAVAAALLARGFPAVVATGFAILAGTLAGGLTGVLNTRLRVTPLLAGVLTSTALYSVSLFVMGSGNVSLVSADGFVNVAERLAHRWFGLPPSLTLFGAIVSGGSIASLGLMLLLAVGTALLLAFFLNTEIGTAMRAAGNNPQMARALAIDVNGMVVLGLCLANGLVALSGALMAQYEGFANIQMGIGALVTGLANLLLGEALLGRRTLGRWIAGAVVGAVAFRLLVGAAIRAGLDPNALKLVTAALVLGVLVLPRVLRRSGLPTEASGRV